MKIRNVASDNRSGLWVTKKSYVKSRLDLSFLHACETQNPLEENALDTLAKATIIITDYNLYSVKTISDISHYTGHLVSDCHDLITENNVLVLWNLRCCWIKALAVLGNVGATSAYHLIWGFLQGKKKNKLPDCHSDNAAAVSCAGSNPEPYP